MVNEKVVTIDLGSAYTKISVRKGWDSESKLIHDPEIATPEATYCIPSDVAVVPRGRSTHWQIGVEAANQFEGNGVRVYRNWKAGLFADTPEGALPRDDGASNTALEVALHFFEELLKRLTEGAEIRAPTIGVRVCIPKLQGENAITDKFENMLFATGWTPCNGRITVYEPESNVLGLVSRGRNATWFPLRGQERKIRFQAMLEVGPFQRAFREVQEEGYGVLVTDIGAFTTDFAYLHFDSGFHSDDWNRPSVKQRSVRLGIRDLDEALKTSLGDELRILASQVSGSRWDSLKSMIYAGKEVEIPKPGGGRLKVGGKRHAAAVTSMIQSFAQEIWEKRRAFCEEIPAGSVRAEEITGGGSLIESLEAILLDFIDNEVDPAYRANKFIRANRLLSDRWLQYERDREVYLRQSQELRRGGSALGGCSVFFA